MKPNQDGKWWSRTWGVVEGCHADFSPRFFADRLEWPLHWPKPQVVFVAPRGDLLVQGVPFTTIARVLEVVCDERCEQHIFVLLTKRPERWLSFLHWLGECYGGDSALPVTLETRGHIPNLVLGASVSTQAEWDERVPKQCRIPAWRRVVNLEPMLGPIDMRGIDPPNLPPGSIRWNAPIHGIICGGESGPGARPVHLEWVRSLRDQCKAAGVDFYFKQWGEWAPLDDWRERLSARQLYDNRPRVRFVRLDGQDTLADGDQDMAMVRVGKKRAGRVLDGHTHDSLAWETKGVRQ